ncbi:PREDICTED: gamma-tubulin complex component 6-like [Acropora digitifera]|uniref:gamma-tubulin complex component 6-like n=1 Tax=Acropora digitifera TaxID=70779 RepID=UPI00077AEEF9|nr:PREDICTED: gamma-tubulin complex component 6-like [Acropora digitifera]
MCITQGNCFESPPTLPEQGCSNEENFCNNSTFQVFEELPGTFSGKAKFFSCQDNVEDAFKRESRASLFSALVHSRTDDMQVKLSLPQLPSDSNTLHSLATEQRESAEDEGFESLETSSNSSFSSSDQASVLHDNMDIWSAALKLPSQRCYTWEMNGRREMLKEKPYLSEAGPVVFDAMYDTVMRQVSYLVKSPSLSRNMVSMVTLINDAINVLIGVPSKTFLFDKQTFSFHVSKHIRLSGTSPEMLSNVLARLSAMGTDYIQLNKFATHHRGQAAGLVLQAFLGAVQNYLHCYRATVLSVDAPSVQSPLQLSFAFEKLAKQLRFLANVCMCSEAFKRAPDDPRVKFPAGVKLLTYLYQLCLEHSSSQFYPILLSLLRHSVMPYIAYPAGEEAGKTHIGSSSRGAPPSSVIQDIMYPRGEGSGGEDTRVSTRGHEPEVKVKKIMYYGKNREERTAVESQFKQFEFEDVWLASEVEPLQDNFDILDEKPSADLLQGALGTLSSSKVSDGEDTDAALLMSLPVLLQRSVMAPVLAQVSLVNSAIVAYFIDDLQINKHFNLFKKLLFMEDGEFSLSLSNQLFEKLTSGISPRDMCSATVLNGIVGKALQSSVYSEITEHAQHIAFALKTLPDIFKQNEMGTLDFLELRYTVEWPLNIVITEKSIVKYNKIFSFMLRLKRLSWVLRDVWFHLKHIAFSRDAAMSPQLRQLQLFRHEMQHFVHNLEGYLSNQILNVTWSEFQEGLTNVFLSCFPAVVSKLVQRGYQSYWADFLLRINFNDFYSVVADTETNSLPP